MTILCQDYCDKKKILEKEHRNLILLLPKLPPKLIPLWVMIPIMMIELNVFRFPF